MPQIETRNTWFVPVRYTEVGRSSDASGSDDSRKERVSAANSEVTWEPRIRSGDGIGGSFPHRFPSDAM